ncbi:hypothetical protein [Prescottella agglutinans]|uniref:Fluoride ion transporter CrcB n=1 Tax=Prescottella agglutinans TaxID=1644129 RepID=A0ABT6MD06_9NOCA|nr:hypothetical protein [Prescottella agglutinans]MDH6281789.1 hypothetical protein [Prescottella agglutinans]
MTGSDVETAPAAFVPAAPAALVAPAPSALVVSGLTELAAGALSGWVFAAVRRRPEAMRALGVRAPQRIRQWHLDLAMLGGFTAICGTAVPAAPRVTTAALAIGAWSNAFAFLPLAFKPDLENRPAYLGLVVGSFVTTSIGFCGIARTAHRRYRAR